MASGMQELKSRLEVLLGSRPERAAGERRNNSALNWMSASAAIAHRERVGAAGGELLGAAFKLLGELVTDSAATPPSSELVASLRAGLDACVEGDDRPRLTITLPSRAVLDQLSQSLARLLVASSTPSTQPVA